MPKTTNLRAAPTGAGTSTSLYMRDISQYDLLERDEEQRLATLIQAGRAATERLSDGPRPSPAERRQLVKDRNAGEDARSTLINHNLRLVVSVAKKYAKPGLDLLDVIGEGNIGLIKAVDSFQPGHGTKFSTWGMLWIKQAVSRGSHAVERAIRLPASVIEDAHRCIRAQSDLSQQLGRKPTTAEIADHTGISTDRVDAALDLRHPSSLDSPLGRDGDGSTLEEVIPDNSRDLADVVSGQMAVDRLPMILSILTDEEQRVLLARLGLDGPHDVSIASIADRFEMTRERVRACEQKAMAKLRHPRYQFVRHAAVVSA